MKTKNATLIFGLFFSLIVLGLSNNAICQKTTYPKIKDIKGYLYYNQNKIENKLGGTFSENIIDAKDFTLWNTIIGEGSALAPSDNTMIVVEIIADPNESSINGYVKLTATNDKNKVLFSQEQYYSIIEKGNTYSAPFMLINTGCETIKLKAQLIKDKKTVTMLEKSIIFNCGE